MINKNFYRKTNDKKILHKVGKQWKVISVALLMAIAGGAAATHANANADVNADNASVDDTVAQLNTSATANPPHNAAKFSANSSVASSASVSGGPYYYSQANNGFSGYNGSAASYFDNVDKDNAVVSKNYNTVNSYVQSLNDEYNPEIHSFGVKSASAKNAASNDSKLAKSYAATARNTNTFNTINSLAAKNNVTPSIYEDMVQDNEQIYSNAVSDASANVKANNDVASLVNKFENANLSEASLKASTASVVTNSNLSAAIYASNSVSARFNSYLNNSASDFVTVANKLSADMIGLTSNDNPIGQGAAYASLVNDTPAANMSAVKSNISASAASLGKAYKASYSAALESAVKGNSTDLTSFANSGANANWFGTTGNYNGVVSEAANSSFAGILASAVSSLFGTYNVASADALNNSAVRSSALASADAAYLAASYAHEFADANSSIASSLDSTVGDNVNSKASFANANLQNGVDSLGVVLGLLSSASNKVTTYGRNIFNSTNFENTVNSSLGASDSALFNSFKGSLSIDASTYTTTEADLQGQISDANADLGAMIKDLNDVNSSAASATTTDGIAFTNTMISGATSGSHTVTNGQFSNITNLMPEKSVATASSADSSAAGQNIAKAVMNSLSTNDASANLSTVTSDLNSEESALSRISTVIGNIEATNSSEVTATGLGTGTKTVSSLAPTSNYFATSAALLSDGFNFEQLEAESSEVDNVANAANTANGSYAANTKTYVPLSSADNLANDLNAASSSAESALGSATSVSNSYASATDEDVTLSSYFATSYASDADNESNASVTENNSLAGFLKSMAGSSAGDFDSAIDAYNNAQYAAAEDYKLGVGYAQAIYNNHAHFLDVLKNAKLHSTPNFGSKNFGDKIVGSVNKGDRLTVYGVNVSRNHNWRGVVRYYVKDNTNGNKGFVTGQLDYTKPAYLSAIGAHNGVEVKTLKPVNVYDQENGGKVVAQLPAGKVLEDADVVYDNADEDAYGFTKVETASDDYLTANTDYVQILNPTVNKPANNTPSEFNFNLGNGQNMAPYYNNLSQN